MNPFFQALALSSCMVPGKDSRNPQVQRCLSELHFEVGLELKGQLHQFLDVY